MSDDAIQRRKKRAALFFLLCLVTGAVGGVGSAIIKAQWGEGLASRAFFLAVLLFCSVGLSR